MRIHRDELAEDHVRQRRLPAQDYGNFWNNRSEFVRFRKWMDHMHREGAVHHFDNLAFFEAISRDNGNRMFIIVGTWHQNGVEVHGCGVCDTKMPMVHGVWRAWPPPEGWSNAQFADNRVPRKLRNKS